MAKWFGTIGYVLTEEKIIDGQTTGIFIEVPVEKPYFGDLIKHNRRLQKSDGVNDDISISNDISIVADPFANNNIYAMRYATFNGVKWKIDSVDVQYPRLVLSLGGIYHGDL